MHLMKNANKVHIDTRLKDDLTPLISMTGLSSEVSGTLQGGNSDAVRIEASMQGPNKNENERKDKRIKVRKRTWTKNLGALQSWG